MTNDDERDFAEEQWQAENADWRETTEERLRTERQQEYPLCWFCVVFTKVYPESAETLDCRHVCRHTQRADCDCPHNV